MSKVMDELDKSIRNLMKGFEDVDKEPEEPVAKEEEEEEEEQAPEQEAEEKEDDEEENPFEKKNPFEKSVTGKTHVKEMDDRDVDYGRDASEREQLDRTYGGDAPQPTKVLTPAEYEEAYNKIMGDSKKGPSIKVTTAAKSVFESVRESDGGEALDVTPWLYDLTKGISECLDAFGATQQSTSMVMDHYLAEHEEFESMTKSFFSQQYKFNNGIAKALTAMTKAIAKLNNAPQARKSRSVPLEKSMGGGQQPSGRIDRNLAMDVLSKSVNSGQLPQTDLTIFEMNNQPSPAAIAILKREGVIS